MRTRWIRASLWLAGFGSLWLNLFDDPPLRSGVYLQDITTAAATVAAISPEATIARCTLRDAAGEVVAELTDTLPCRRHEARFSGLKAGTQYAYEWQCGDVREEGRLRTAPGDDRGGVRFAFCGDSGDQPWWVWLQRTPILHWPARWDWFPTKSAVTQVGAAMAAYAPDFALHLGDVVYPYGRHAHYRSGFFRPFAALLREAPVYAVLGNHDVLDTGGQQILRNFRLPSGEVTGDPHGYSFAWGSVRVIAIDCNSDLTGIRFQSEHPSSRLLRRLLEQVSEPWIVVMSHFPMRSASRQRDRADLLLDLLPLLDEARVSLYLSGHDHCYQRFEPTREGGTPLVVSGGGGKSLYDVAPKPHAVVLAKAFHWCSAETSADTMALEAHALDGSTIDRFVLTLPSAAELDAVRRLNPARARRIEELRRD